MSDINYGLLARLADKPHPLLHIADDFEKQIREIPVAWIGEVFQQARSAHHLLDLARIPRQAGGCYSSDLDARTFQAVLLIGSLQEQLQRIAAWHVRETGPAGMVGDFCVECETRWPCDTSRIATGEYVED